MLIWSNEKETEENNFRFYSVVLRWIFQKEESTSWREPLLEKDYLCMIVEL